MAGAPRERTWCLLAPGTSPHPVLLSLNPHWATPLGDQGQWPALVWSGTQGPGIASAHLALRPARLARRCTLAWVQRQQPCSGPGPGCPGASARAPRPAPSRFPLQAGRAGKGCEGRRGAFLGGEPEAGAHHAVRAQACRWPERPPWAQCPGAPAPPRPAWRPPWCPRWAWASLAPRAGVAVVRTKAWLEKAGGVGQRGWH